MTGRRAELWPEASAVIAVILLAATLRLVNLPENPGWYSDEGTILDIALHLTRGEMQYFALRGPTLIAARMPLFPALVSLILPAFRDPMSALRHTTALIGILTVAGVYGTLRACLGQPGRWLAVTAAFVLAVWPNSIIYNRIGFSYNLLAPVTLAIFWLLWVYLDRRRAVWVIGAAVMAGAGATSDLIAMAFVPPIALVAAYRNWRHAIWSVGAAFLPLAGYAAWMTARAPGSFAADVPFIGGRLAGVPFIAQFPVAALNTARLFEVDPWFLLGLIGLFLLQPPRLRRLGLVLGLVPFVLIARTTTGIASLGYYYLLPILPILAMGMGALVIRTAGVVAAVTRESIQLLLSTWGIGQRSDRSRWLAARAVGLAAALAIFLFVVGPMVISAASTGDGVASRMTTPIDDVLVHPADVRATSAFLEGHTQPEDLVVGSPALIWSLSNHVADFQQAVAAAGGVTEHFPEDIPADRFAFPATASDARFVVVDPIWRNWGAVRIPAVREIMEEAEQWPLVFQAGEISVFANPQAEP